MTDSYDEIEARIQAALAFISREENPNIMKLAWDYAVSVSRLWAHYKEQKNRSNCEWKHHIVSFTLSLYATHLLQSLDVACFQSYKYYHLQVLDWSLCLGIFDFNWLDCGFHQDACKILQEINYSLSLLKDWSYIIQFWEKCWNHFTRNYRSQCLHLLLLCHLLSHILWQIHDLHLIISQNYMNMFVIYIRLVNTLKNLHTFNADSITFSMLVLAEL